MRSIIRNEKNKIKNYKCLLILGAIFFFHIINNFIWLSKEGNIVLSCDEVYHLDNTIAFYRNSSFLLNQKNISVINRASSLLPLFRADSRWGTFQSDPHWWSWLSYFIASVFMYLFGVSNLAIRMSNMFFSQS